MSGIPENKARSAEVRAKKEQFRTLDLRPSQKSMHQLIAEAGPAMKQVGEDKRASQRKKP